MAFHFRSSKTIFNALFCQVILSGLYLKKAACWARDGVLSPGKETCREPEDRLETVWIGQGRDGPG